MRMIDYNFHQKVNCYVPGSILGGMLLGMDHTENYPETRTVMIVQAGALKQRSEFNYLALASTDADYLWNHRFD